MNKPYPKYKPSGVEWLGDVPEHWEVKKLKHVVSLRSGEGITVEDIEESGDYPVYGGNGFRGYTNKFTHNGDFVLIGRQGALCGNINYAKGKFWASEHAVVATPCKPLATIWLGELLRLMNLNQYSISAAQPGLAIDRIKELQLPAPPLPEQQAIAAFLDRETGRIDALITKKERLLELLAEQRTALISRTVTKGLDASVKLKPSGVEWLGDVPEHWEVKKLKFIGTALIGLTYSPDEIVDEDFSGKKHLVLRSTNIQDGKISLHDNVYVTTPVHKELEIRKGDILICARNGSRHLVGKNALVSETNTNMTFGAFTTVYRSNINRFLFYFFASSQFQYQSTGFLTTTINQLTNGNLNSILTTLPPLPEQQAIAAFLDRETAKIDALSAKVATVIERLKEYRTTLISSAVTGKIDVREEV